MMKQLEAIFAELGITQYLDVFVDQGFDTWETILDITESDLDALGVKLGHRRKLQRRIANFRGVAPDASLVSPISQPTVEEPKPEPQVNAAVKLETHDVATTVVAKRKYRRHPKPDENAPERPPSAYVLFSNKMRDDLKGRNLTFTEIAKLVGEHWQNLSMAEKQPFESQAQAAKDRYNNQLAEYKKTADFKKYQDYLEEFKAKYAHQSKDKDATKRLKLSSPGDYQDEGKIANRTRRGRSDSGSPGASPRTDQVSRRHSRLGSVVSATESQISATPASHHTSIDDAVFSPASHTLDRRSSERSPIITTSPRDPGLAQYGRRAWQDDQHIEQTGLARILPSLSDVFDPGVALGSGHTSGDANGFPFPRSYNPDNGGPPPGLVGGETKPPPLKKEQSSAASTSSGSSYSFPRTPIEGSLPIHSLLSEKRVSSDSIPQFYGNSMVTENKLPFLQRQHLDGILMPYTNGFTSNSMQVAEQSPPLATPQQSCPEQTSSQQAEVKPEPNLDGMSALLRAGEIVDRQSR